MHSKNKEKKQCDDVQACKPMDFFQRGGAAQENIISVASSFEEESFVRLKT